MNLPRIAVLFVFVACGVALSAAAKSKMLQESASKPAAQQGDNQRHTSVALRVKIALRSFLVNRTVRQMEDML
jgi:hypothetical protein